MARTDGNTTITLDLEELKELLSGNRLSKDEQLELIQKQAEANAEAHRRLLRPENATHPGISVYSYPEGEAARPKGDLDCKTTWAGTVLEPSTLTPEELTLANAVPEGEYLCKRADGGNMKVTVAAERHPSGKFVKKDIFFVTRGVLKHNLSSMAAMLQEMVAQAAVRAHVMAPPRR